MVTRSRTLLCILLCLCGRTPPSHPQEGPTASQWREDLSFTVDFIRKTHPDPFHSTSERDFTRRTDSLFHAIPRLTGPEIEVELLKTVASLRDWHTRLLGASLVRSWVPVRMEKFPEGLFITAVSREHEALLGARVLRVGGLSASEAFDRAEALNSGDNAHSREYFAPVFLAMPSILKALKAADTEAGLSLRIEKNGREEEAILRPVPFESDPFFSWFWRDLSAPCADPVSLLDRPDDRLPLCMRNTGSPFWWEPLPGRPAVYMGFNRCEEGVEEKFTEFTERLWDWMERNRTRFLILDMRHNLGGDNSRLLPFVHRVIRSDSINRKGHLYVIIGRKNVSAAVHFVSWLETHCRPILAGGPTGAPPNAFGDAEFTQLPHSKLTLMVSKWRWTSAATPWDGREAVAPEIPVATTAADYFNLRDPVLEEILRRIGPPSGS